MNTDSTRFYCVCCVTQVCLKDGAVLAGENFLFIT